MRAITRVRLRVHLKALPQYILVLLNLIITAWICDKWIEATSYAVSFLYFRYRFTDIFHCKTTFRCILMSNILVFIAIPFTVPLSNSLLGGMLMGLGVNYAMDLFASDISRKMEKTEREREKRKETAQSIAAMDEAGICLLCREHLLDDIDAQIVICRLLRHMKGAELYEKIGYSKSQMIRREKKIETELGITLK